jgi:nucleoside-diphosphate-sugar epimerase
VDVLLIGGTGFLGRHVAERLASSGHRVTTLARNTAGGIAVGESLAGDRREFGDLVRVLGGRRFDVTVDLAAYDAADVERLYRVPRLVLGRYVLISTGQVYLVTSSRRMPYREEEASMPLVPEPDRAGPDHAQWTYGVGKRRAERALLALRSMHGVRCTILRLPVLIGAHDRSLRLWAYLERLLDGGPILLPEGGAQHVRFLDPGDVGRVLLGWMGGSWPPQVAYNLAQHEVVTLREALETVARAAERPLRAVDASWEEIDGAGLTRAFSPFAGSWVSVLDPERAVRDFGFEATPMADYLPAAVRWHLEHRPARSHLGYAARAREIEIAERIERGSPVRVRPPEGR